MGIELFFFFILTFSTVAGAQDVLTFNTMESAPYQSVEMENEGYLVALTREAFRRKGYELIVKFVPWKRAIEETKHSDVDGIIGAWFEEQRTNSFAYTHAIGKSTLVFLQRSDNDIVFETLEDLKGYRVGTVAGYIYTDSFDNAKFLNKVVGRSTALNVRALLYQRIDITPEVEEVVHYILKKKYPDHVGQIKRAGEPLAVHSIYNIISKNNPRHQQLVTDFNKGLQEMKRDGTYKRIYKDFELELNN